jgi:hypothetical protein
MNKPIEDTKIGLVTAKLCKEKKFDAIVKGSITEYLNTKIDREYPEGGGPFGYKKGELEGSEGYFRNFDPGADFSNKNYIMYARPTQSVLQRWLREVHNIQVYVVSGTLSGTVDGVRKYKDYVVHICVASSRDNEVGRVFQTAINDARDEEFQTYEEAMEVGLQHALEML